MGFVPGGAYGRGWGVVQITEISLCVCVGNRLFVRKIRAPIKIKSALPPPPKPPPKKEEFYGHRFSCRKNAFFPGVHKIGAAISGPRIADTNFTDTGTFLNLFVLLWGVSCRGGGRTWWACKCEVLWYSGWCPSESPFG